MRTMRVVALVFCLSAPSFALSPMTWFGLASAVLRAPELYRETKRGVKAIGHAAKKVTKRKQPDPPAPFLPAQKGKLNP